jgi:hypothetical protein
MDDDNSITNVILILLVIAIIIHFIYNNTKNQNEHMCEKPKKVYDDGKDREPGTRGLYRTKEPWYHVVNQQITNQQDVNDATRKKNKNCLIFDDLYAGQLIPKKFYDTHERKTGIL